MTTIPIFGLVCAERTPNGSVRISVEGGAARALLRVLSEPVLAARLRELMDATPLCEQEGR